MPRTAVVFSPEYYKHNTGKNHPESAKRLHAIVKELRQGQLSQSRKWQFVKPEKASVDDLILIHDKRYIKKVRDICRSGGGLLDTGDTIVSSETFDVARYAVGGAVKAVCLVMQGCYENSFALVRPPGHHATRHYGLGFCVFNNVAIATKLLLRDFKLKRVLILDIDSHHGNGTQQAFIGTDEVLYISLHENPRDFPGTGFAQEVGEGRGCGHTVNIPLPFGTDDQTYLKAWNEIVVPIALQYRPQFVLVSAGLDCHYADPVGELSLSVLGYNKIFQSISSLAGRSCSGKLALVLEGGYDVKYIGKIAASAIATMSGSTYTVNDKVPVSNLFVKDEGKNIMKEVKEIQRNYWQLR